jgi:hypothetical protein
MLTNSNDWRGPALNWVVADVFGFAPTLGSAHEVVCGATGHVAHGKTLDFLADDQLRNALLEQLQLQSVKVSYDDCESAASAYCASGWVRSKALVPTGMAMGQGDTKASALCDLLLNARRLVQYASGVEPDDLALNLVVDVPEALLQERVHQFEFDAYVSAEVGAVSTAQAQDSVREALHWALPALEHDALVFEWDSLEDFSDAELVKRNVYALESYARLQVSLASKSNELATKAIETAMYDLFSDEVTVNGISLCIVHRDLEFMGAKREIEV